MTENSVPEEVGPRRSRRGLPIEEFQPLPELALLEKTNQAAAELKAAYKVLQRIKRLKYIDPFKDEPKTFYFGMSAYFEIVPHNKTMWLNKIQEKIENGIYPGICDFIADLQQMLINCYKYWSQDHRITIKGFVIERQMMKSLADDNILPVSVREKIVCPLSKTNCLVCEAAENGLGDQSSEFGHTTITDDQIIYKSRLLESKIWNKCQTCTLTSVPDNSIVDKDAIEKWERDIVDSEKITNCGELGEIGLFLKVLGRGLNLGEVTQFEIERMLFVPTAPSFLQTLMTWIFTSDLKRKYLDLTPLMPYEVWNSKLRKKIDTWMKYSDDQLQGQKATGINCDFWRICKENPLKGLSLGQLSNFYVRVWILKALLEYLLHSDKSVADIFAENSDDDSLKYVISGDDLRCLKLGKDLIGWEYYAIPQFLPEIRIYKQLLPPPDSWSNDDENSNKIQDSTLEFRLRFSTEDKVWLPSEVCTLVVDNVCSLDRLIENLKNENESTTEKDSHVVAELVAALVEFRSRVIEEDSEKKRFEGLRRLHAQCEQESAEKNEELQKAYNEYRKKPFKAETFTVAEKDDEIFQNQDITSRRKTAVTYASDDSDEFMLDEILEPYFDDKGDLDWGTPSKAKRMKKEVKSQVDSDQQPPVEKETKNARRSEKATKKTMSKKAKEVASEGTSSTIDGTTKTVPKDDIQMDSGRENKNTNVDDVIIVEPKTEVICISDDEDDVKPNVNEIRTHNIDSAQIETQPAAKRIVAPNNNIGSLTVQIPPNLQHRQISVTTRSAPPTSPQRIIGQMPIPMVLPTQVTPRKKPMPMPIQLPPSPLTPPKTPPGRSVTITPSRRQAQTTPRQPILTTPQHRPLNQMSPRQGLITPSRVQFSPVRGGMVTSPNGQAKNVAYSPLPARRGGVTTTPPRLNQVSPRQNQITPGRGQMARGQQITPRPYPQPIPNNQQGGARRELFQKPSTQPTVEGTFCIATDELGEMRYSIKFPDGGVRYLTDQEKAAIVRNNGGIVPRKVAMPLDGRFV